MAKHLLPCDRAFDDCCEWAVSEGLSTASQCCLVPEPFYTPAGAADCAIVGRQRIPAHALGSGDEAKRLSLLGLVRLERGARHRIGTKQRPGELDQIRAEPTVD